MFITLQQSMVDVMARIIMKIAFVSDVIYPFVKGGAERRIAEFAKRLAHRGHDVHVFGLKWWTGKHILRYENIVLHGLARPLSMYTGSRRSIGEAIWFATLVLSRLPHKKFDVIDCAQSPVIHCYPTKLRSMLNRTPLVLTWHEFWDAYWVNYLGLMGSFGRMMEFGVTKLANTYVTGTERTKQKLVTAGLRPEQIKVVPNGVDYGAIQRIEAANNDLDVVFSGRFVATKRVDTVIKAVNILKNQFPRIKVGIIGDGPERAYLHRLTSQFQLSENIKFYGEIPLFEDVMAIIKTAKVFVYPIMNIGGSGIASLEANACGVPVIMCKDDYGEPEVVIDGYNGFVTQGAIPELIAEKVALLLNDDRLREKLSNGAHQFAQLNDWENITNMIEAVYREMQA